MAKRTATTHRQTKETDVQITIDLDGSGQYRIETGIGFLDHLLTHVAAHGLFDLTVQATGDLYVDPHHTVEDVALVLGQAFAEALGDKGGIVRMGSAYVPMDEALAFVAVDLSGRPYCVAEVAWTGSTVGAIPATLIPHFFESLAAAARANVHARVLYGRDDHHKAEALFKALGRALDAATRPDPRRGGKVPSTKGTL
jgi:imidazoleglycerol-phosphate dehydratase